MGFLLSENKKYKDKCIRVLNEQTEANQNQNCKSKGNVLKKEYMALVEIILSLFTAAFVTTLLCFHFYFSSRNMSTYSNIKMGEIFAIYGNPFSRKNCWKNLKQVLCVKYKKRINFCQMKCYSCNGTHNDLSISQKDSIIIFKRNVEKKGHGHVELFSLYKRGPGNERQESNNNISNQSNTFTNLTFIYKDNTITNALQNKKVLKSSLSLTFENTINEKNKPGQ